MTLALRRSTPIGHSVASARPVVSRYYCYHSYWSASVLRRLECFGATVSRVSLWSVGRVEPEDDSIRRFIVHHYRYDPARRERRHVVVAAFDNEPEFLACVERVGAEIRQRRELGERVDPREHASGVVHDSGYLRRAANGHLLRRAFRHGVAGLKFE
jgi:hypothetical protein